MKTITLLLLFVFVTSACSRSTPGVSTANVRIVLPDRYRGYFWIVVDRSNGNPVPIQQGVITLRIPEDGVLLVQDDSFFDQYRLEAERVSGQGIPVHPVESQAQVKDEMVWTISTSADGYSTFAVGTRSLFVNWWRSKSVRDQVRADLNRRLQSR